LPEIDIEDLEYLPQEITRGSADEKLVIFDILCKDNKGEEFIVEMQLAGTKDFRNRMFYYGASLIHNQVKSSETYDMMKPVYVICVTGFDVPHSKNVEGKVSYVYKTMEVETNELYGDQMTILFLELEKVSKNLEELNSPIEEWLYLIENCSTFVRPPERLKEYSEVFEAARVGGLSTNELNSYFMHIIDDTDLDSMLEFRFDEGVQKGKAEVARKMLEMGIPEDVVAKCTGLSIEEIGSLKS